MLCSLRLTDSDQIYDAHSSIERSIVRQIDQSASPVIGQPASQRCRSLDSTPRCLPGCGLAPGEQAGRRWRSACVEWQRQTRICECASVPACSGCCMCMPGWLADLDDVRKPSGKSTTSTTKIPWEIFHWASSTRVSTPSTTILLRLAVLEGQTRSGGTLTLAGILLLLQVMLPSRNLSRRILLATSRAPSQAVNWGKVSRPHSAFHSMRIPCWAQ